MARPRGRDEEGHGDVQGTPFVEMALENHLRPVETAVRTTYLTSRAAAFVASDRARTMTAATANVSCGALID